MAIGQAGNQAQNYCLVVYQPCYCVITIYVFTIKPPLRKRFPPDMRMVY